MREGEESWMSRDTWAVGSARFVLNRDCRSLAGSDVVTQVLHCIFAGSTQFRS